MSHIYIFTEIILVNVYIIVKERKSNIILKKTLVLKSNTVSVVMCKHHRVMGRVITLAG